MVACVPVSCGIAYYRINLRVTCSSVYYSTVHYVT
jgi:hypothetical protein